MTFRTLPKYGGSAGTAAPEERGCAGSTAAEVFKLFAELEIEAQLDNRDHKL